MPPQIENNTPQTTNPLGTEHKPTFPKWAKISLIVFGIITISFSAFLIFAFMYIDDALTVKPGPEAKFTTTTNEFADWKTYRNEEYGFEIKYPNTWQQDDLKSPVVFLAPPKINVLQIEILRELKSPEEVASGEIKENNCPPTSDYEGDHIINISDQHVLFVLYCSATTEDYVYLRKHGSDKLIKINYNDDFDSNWPEKEKLKTFNKILSTFKFISTSTTVINTGDSGIRGKVTIGPTCPVERMPPDPQCADKPYKTKLRIVKENTSVVVFAESDVDGNYSIKLGPGTYYITVPDLSKQMPSLSETRVVVLDGKYTDTNLQFDSGIR